MEDTTGNDHINIIVMNKNLLIIVLLFLSVCQVNSQDFEVSFDGGEAVIDSIIATNLSTGESIKIPGDASLILRKTTTGIHTSQYEGGRLPVIYPSDGNVVIINYPSILPQKISIQFYDISGRVLAQKGFNISQGINQFTISAKQHGVYFVHLLAGDNCYNAKVILNGQGNNSISFLGYNEFNNSNNQLKSISGDSYIMLFSTGDIISYEFYSRKSTTIINEIAGTSAILSPKFHNCVDYEENNYSIVKIGDQWWMAENIRSTRYADGTEILLLEDNDLWLHLLPTEKAYCFYNNESLGYGALYTFAAAVNGNPYDGSGYVQGICPNGWNLPSNDEWMELENYLINQGFNYDGTTIDNKFGKSLASTSGWSNSEHIEGAVGNNQRTNNRTGFNAIPAGFRSNVTGEFLNEGISGNWWSSAEDSIATANKLYLETNFSSLNHHYINKSNGYSVRCIKNNDDPFIVNFTTNKTVVAMGETVTFTDLSSGKPTEWNWDFGDCNSSKEQNPSHIYYSPGIYSVFLIAKRSAEEASETKTDYIVVTESEKRTIADTEGNIYKTVKIGNQLWMAENLESTRYTDGTEIPHVTDNTEWGSLAADNTTKAYCFYNNNKSIGHGALYTYAAAVNGNPYDGSGYIQGICPEGWHVPVEAEWTELENYLIANGYNYDGSTIGNKISKSLASTSGWTISTGEGAVGNNQSTNNRSDFHGLPGGYRSYYSTTGEFAGAGDGGSWWMATDVFDETAMYWNLYYNFKHVLRDYTFKRTGLSVRCLKNDDGSPLADFKANTTEVHLGEIVNFTDKSTNSPTGWIWNFDNCGDTSTEQNPSHRFTREGLHSVTLIASNDTGFDVETKKGYITITQRKSLVNDIEGNIYRTVEIGNQWWMAENLKTTKFNDGTDIYLVVIDNSNWLGSSTPAYGWYDNSKETYGEWYGALYNWYTVNTGNLCPSGWHVPTDSDWKELESSLGMLPKDLDTLGWRGDYVGSKLAGNAGLWSYEGLESRSLIKFNVHFGSSGFTALPGGSIYPYSESVDFVMRNPGVQGSWWSSTEFDSDDAWHRYLLLTNTQVFRHSRKKEWGASVRCVQD